MVKRVFGRPSMQRKGDDSEGRKQHPGTEDGSNASFGKKECDTVEQSNVSAIALLEMPLVRTKNPVDASNVVIHDGDERCEDAAQEWRRHRMRACQGGNSD